MGNSGSSSSLSSVSGIGPEHKEVLLGAKSNVMDRCEAYLDYIEETSAVVDLAIKALDKSISAEIVAFAENPVIKGLDANDRLILESDLSYFGNMQKSSIRKMLVSFRDTHAVFESLLDDSITNALRKNADLGDGTSVSDAGSSSDDSEGAGVARTEFNQIVPESEIFSMGYAICSDVLDKYRQELLEMSFPSSQRTNRQQRFRRLLFKSFDRAVTESLQMAIYERKESAFYRIDSAYRSGLQSGAFGTGPQAAGRCKKLIDHITEISNEEVHNLLQMPVLHHGAIDIATREVLTHAIKSVRQCQLSFANDARSMQLLMDNEFDRSMMEEDGSFAVVTVNNNKKKPAVPASTSDSVPESVDSDELKPLVNINGRKGKRSMHESVDDDEESVTNGKGKLNKTQESKRKARKI
jgi:hypothetical protein